jgi:Bacterial lipid A biosynthesis acyltransferase
MVTGVGAPLHLPLVIQMNIRDIGEIGKITALTLIAWLLPPRLWRQAAWATSSIGRDDKSGPSYQQNLAHKFSKSEIATIRYKRRAYLRELKFQILGLIGPWRSWRPHIRLVGADHLRKALDDGHGAILWVTETVFSTLIAKIALHDAGYHAYQLSRPQHGFSTSPFGVRFLNPIWTGVEDRFIAERIVINGETAADALAILRARIAVNQIIIITVVPQAHKLVQVPFLRAHLPLATGPIRLARTTGATLLPVFTFARDDGGFEVSISEPLFPTDGPADDESIAAAYAEQLESSVLDYPDQWSGWHWLT